ncbi:hypothetical protein PHYPO_G00065040 [Pangasianodon hypophthalmus]|uniref:Uncharacterized protein n=1 Tax=Pangasianodon hypophthalmus TaxID=310915 RepID=A0A5N5M2H1_PANHP|nr:hypothetical protein PHYPO_G00065040 [Pangasianodon hypophthalmus]
MTLLSLKTTFPSVLQREDFLKLKAPRAALTQSVAPRPDSSWTFTSCGTLRGFLRGLALSNGPGGRFVKG